jgi:hypothetical protein
MCGNHFINSRPVIAGVAAFLLSITAHAGGFSEVSACKRPEPGAVEGACAVRAYPELNIASPYAPLRWMACLQSELHLPSGGYGDAVFFTDLIPEWEKEIEANLLSLERILSGKDRKILKNEQQTWLDARKRAAIKHSKQSQPLGTMYLMFGAAAELSYPESRAIELACRIEKLTAK